MPVTSQNPETANLAGSARQAAEYVRRGLGSAGAVTEFDRARFQQHLSELQASTVPFTGDDIDKAIETGQYTADILGPYSDNPTVINKCNLFVDDMLQQHYGVTLPRFGEDPEWSKHYPGWEDRPMFARSLLPKLDEYAGYDDSGVKALTPEEAVKAANSGLPVVAISPEHAALLPSDAQLVKTGIKRQDTGNEAVWVDAYRSDLTVGRAYPKGHKKRTRSNVSDRFSFYSIEPKAYSRFRAEESARKQATR